MANGDTIVEHRLDTEGADPLLLAGVNDRNMQEIVRLFGIRVVLRGDHLILSGSLPAVEGAVPVLQHMVELARLRAPFDTPDIARFADGIAMLPQRPVDGRVRRPVTREPRRLGSGVGTTTRERRSGR